MGALLLAAAGNASAAISTGAVAQDTVRTTTVVAGEDYAAGGFHRFLWGDHYRGAWTTEVEVKILDLSQFAGGLTPLSAGGGFQTKSLWLAGSDGKPYAFRGIFKNAARMVPEVFHGTFVEELAQDQMSLQHPFGPLVAERLEHAAGVLHTDPEVFVLPDDPALGEFQGDFADVLGILSERPAELEGRLTVYPGLREIVDGFEMVERVQADPSQRVHSPSFLRARLLDLLLGDFDRHADQWRWADFGPDSTPGWRSIPRDRDLAFARLDGLILSVGRSRIPMLTSFGKKYGDVARLHYQARFIDRLYLTDLERDAFDSVAVDLAARLGDDVIDEAVQQLPPEIEAVDGDFFRTVLRARRDALPVAASDLYELLAREPYVHGTDVAEVAEITGRDGLSLEVTLRDADGDSKPYFRRIFHARETNEIRIYLHGGNDRAVIEGRSTLPIRVRIIGGDGDDEYHFATRTSNAALYDQTGSNRVTGASQARIDARTYDRPTLVPESGSAAPPRHSGGFGYPDFRLGYSPDFGLVVRGDHTWIDYGFRKDPHATRVKVSAMLATRLKGSLVVGADFRMENSPLFFTADAVGSSMEILQFFGIGNDAERTADASKDFYDVNQRVVRGRVAIRHRLGEESSVGIGLLGQYSNTRRDSTRILGQFPDLYGAGPFTSAGAELALDVRTPTAGFVEIVEPETRGALDVTAAYYPALLDVESAYGLVDAVGILAFPLGFRLSEVAFRGGGRKTWGEVPLSDLAFIGGNKSLRGLPVQRYAGDSSLYGGTELRLDLFDYRLIFPSTFGILGLLDGGRVWVDGDSPGGWHYGYGGGIWLALRGTRSILSLVYAKSDEDQGVYLNFGFSY